MKNISLGYSPCPNDTFIFYALIHNKIKNGELNFDEVLLDVETLNQKALKAELDVTKISYAAFGHLRKDYCLLKSGGALGRGCGPLLITKHDYKMEDLRDKKVANFELRQKIAFLVHKVKNLGTSARTLASLGGIGMKNCKLQWGLGVLRLLATIPPY